MLPNEAKIKDGEYGKDLCLFPIENTIEITDPTTNEKSEISFKGYFYYQQTRIIPQQLRGMLVRIKNVAIGGPNLDFWGHPYTGDAVYFPQTFGEIYFDSGLEEAMNIDRSTFKTSDYEYAETKKALHKYLRDDVFTTAKKMYSKRRTEKADTKQKIRLNARIKTVKNELGQNYKIHEIRRFKPEVVEIQKEKKAIIVNPLADPLDGFKKNERLMFQDVALALEIAFETGHNQKEIKELFWKILRDLTDWVR